MKFKQKQMKVIKKELIKMRRIWKMIKFKQKKEMIKKELIKIRRIWKKEVKMIKKELIKVRRIRKKEIQSNINRRNNQYLVISENIKLKIVKLCVLKLYSLN